MRLRVPLRSSTWLVGARCVEHRVAISVAGVSGIDSSLQLSWTRPCCVVTKGGQRAVRQTSKNAMHCHAMVEALIAPLDRSASNLDSRRDDAAPPRHTEHRADRLNRADLMSRLMTS